MSLPAGQSYQSHFSPYQLLTCTELRNTIYKMFLSDPAGHHLVKTRSHWRRVVSRVAPKAFLEVNAEWGKRHRYPWYFYHYRSQREDAVRNASSDNTTAGNVTSDHADTDIAEPPPFKKLATKILTLSKSIYDEAIGFLYSKPIILTDTYALHSFLIQIGPKHRAMLRDVEVCEWGSTGARQAMNYPAMSSLADAINLQRLKLNVNKYGVSI
jgi:hypothetical protein